MTMIYELVNGLFKNGIQLTFAFTEAESTENETVLRNVYVQIPCNNRSTVGTDICCLRYV